MAIQRISYINRFYDQETCISVGQTFDTGVMSGTVHLIQLNNDNSVSIFILPNTGEGQTLAMWISPELVGIVYFTFPKHEDK